IQLELKGTDTKKNQYTINVLADDKSFEKKNRSVNEPIFFYTGGNRQAVELVINKVNKTTATGYLSVPKSVPATAASSNNGSRQSDRMIHPFVWDQSLLPLVLSGRAKHPYRPRCS